MALNEERGRARLPDPELHLVECGIRHRKGFRGKAERVHTASLSSREGGLAPALFLRKYSLFVCDLSLPDFSIC